jgi:hypothetical protein
MSVWTTANTSRTRDPRVRVGQWGEGNWRTLVQEDGEWDITGPPYPTKAVALGHVDDVLADYFGELPGRALLAGRIEAALKLARECGGIDGAHHKMWVINRMVEELTGGRQSLPQKGMAP